MLDPVPINHSFIEHGNSFSILSSERRCTGLRIASCVTFQPAHTHTHTSIINLMKRQFSLSGTGIRFKERSHVTISRFQFLTNGLTCAMTSLTCLYLSMRYIKFVHMDINSKTVFTVTNSSLQLYYAIRNKYSKETSVSVQCKCTLHMYMTI